MRKKLVAGNWKMNGSYRSNSVLLAEIVASIDRVSCDVLLCVPYPYLAQVGGVISGKLMLGAQNLSEFSSGAYTGEVSASMLVDVGCAYVLVGHSERRTLFAESAVIAANKCSAALAQGLRPIVCVGESLTDRESGQTETVIQNQLLPVLNALDVSGLRQLVVAYEPIWAIGTGKTARPGEVQAVHAFIRNLVAKYDQGVADGLRILYGGSVKPDSAQELFAQPDVDGGLIGGASLVAGDFLAICQAANG